MYQNLFDSHTHSESSLDGVHSVTFMAESAYEKNIQGFSVTDHCECDQLEKYDYFIRQKQSELDVMKTRAAFRRRIILTHGMELGNPQHDYVGAKSIIASQHFDFILLSLHRMRGWEDFYNLDYARMAKHEIDSMMRAYFTELLEIVKWGHFDSLAHMSLPLRYAARQDVRIDLADYADEVDTVLRALVGMGKALEINTSGLRGPLMDMLPPFWAIERFRELGGETVTIGSDAHSAHDIGKGIRDGMHLLLESGFEYFAFFRDRQPVMLRII